MKPCYRITIAEDDSNVVFLLHYAITRAFTQSAISCFSNAEDALQHIHSRGADILITDHGMGEMSGLDLIRGLRRDGSRIPIIMVSGNPAVQSEARVAGANEFVDKASGLQSLPVLIEKLVSREADLTCRSRQTNP